MCWSVGQISPFIKDIFLWLVHSHLNQLPVLAELNLAERVSGGVDVDFAEVLDARVLTLLVLTGQLSEVS